MTNNYDIFISYRRDGGFETAKHLHDLLIRDGYTVSFDIDTLREGDFDKLLLERINQCTDFVLIIDKHAFDRTLDKTFDKKKDWLRIELAYALKAQKNIIPIFLNGIKQFPSNLPDDIAGVMTKNAPEYNMSYFDEFYKKLKTFLQCSPRKQEQKRYIVGIVIVAVLITLGIISCFLIFNSSKKITEKAVLPQDSTATMQRVKDSVCINPIAGEFKFTGSIDRDKKPHGKGIALFPQGDIYVGEFYHGNIEGHGIYENKSVGERFEGTFKNNERFEGTYVWDDGTYFTGSFVKNEPYKGIYRDVHGNILKEY